MMTPILFRFVCAGVGLLFGAGGYLAAETAINEQTYVPLFVMFAAVVFVGGLMWKIRGWYEYSARRIDRLDERIDKLEKADGDNHRRKP